MTTTPTDQRALVERLRATQLLYVRGPNYEPVPVEPGALRLEAADLIEALQAELAEAVYAERQRGQAIINERDEWIVELIRERDEARALAVEQRGDQGSSSAKAPTIPAVDGDGSNLTGWQPMETAPKDGTPMLLVNPDGATGIGWILWEEQFGGHLSSQGAYAKHHPRSKRVSLSIGGWKPEACTHWQPLPAPPAEADTHAIPDSLGGYEPKANEPNPSDQGAGG